MPLEPQAFLDRVAKSEQILVVYGRDAGFSAVAMATSLYLWLRRQDKKVSFVSPAAPVVEFSHFVGINKVKTLLTGENLVIRLPLPASQIEKVISDLQGERDELSLIIKPKRTAESISITSLPVSYLPPDYDLICMIDVASEEELEPLGSVTADFWRRERNFVWHTFANPLTIPASLDITLGKDETFASHWGNFCRMNNLQIDADQASNLLMALEEDSDHFGTARSSAETFELAAWLMRQGGQRYVEDERALNDFRPENHLPQMIGFQNS